MVAEAQLRLGSSPATVLPSEPARVVGVATLTQERDPTRSELVRVVHIATVIHAEARPIASRDLLVIAAVHLAATPLTRENLREFLSDPTVW